MNKAYLLLTCVFALSLFNFRYWYTHPDHDAYFYAEASQGMLRTDCWVIAFAYTENGEPFYLFKEPSCEFVHQQFAWGWVVSVNTTVPCWTRFDTPFCSSRSYISLVRNLPLNITYAIVYAISGAIMILSGILCCAVNFTLAQN